MKQHITPSQAKQLTEGQFYSLFEEIVPRKNWSNYHHRKMTIGKMIEILGTVTITRSDDGNLWVVDDRYTHKELVDALWEAVLGMFQFLK